MADEPTWRGAYRRTKGRQGVDPDIDRDTDTDEDVGTDMETRRLGAARKAIGALSPEFKEQVGPGLAVLLEKQKVSQADVEEWQSASPGKPPGIVDAARGALGKRIAEDYPDWDDVKIDDYINAGTLNDFPDTTPKRGMPEGEFPEEGLESVGPAFPPPETLESVGSGFPDQGGLKSVTVPEVPEEEGSTQQKPPEDQHGSVLPFETQERMKRMREAYGLDPERVA